MSTSTITTDTTRTRQKSQLMDDPYLHNLHLHHVLTELLSVNVYTSHWFHEVSKILNIRKKDLAYKALETYWKKSWGVLALSAYNNIIVWVRPDQGPEMAQSKIDARIIVIRYMLMATLIEVLSNLNMSSYEKVGVTSNWNRAKVKLNSTEIENVSWADALTGKVAIKAMMEDEKILTGYVAIYLEKENLSFF